jgi:Zn finger protein HypA/HybF involved in hydrogenase expression
VSARCRQCGEVFLPDHHLRLCPSCGATDAELTNPTGVWIESIDVEEP